MENIIAAENLTFAYEGASVPVLSGLSLAIKKGSFTAIVGPNGSGKSTLARLFNGLLLPTGGKLLVEGMDTADGEKLWEIRRLVGMVFQNPDNQLVSPVVEDDVAFGPENLGIEPRQIRERVDRALEAVGMEAFRSKGPHLLSGGQKQRVAVAGVLAMEPECLVLDEPTAMLDPSGRAEVMALARQLHQEGKTVVWITHFMEEAAMADRIIVLSRGILSMDGPAEKIFSMPKELKALGLELPFAVEMADRLRSAGIALPPAIITLQQLTEALCAYKSAI